MREYPQYDLRHFTRFHFLEGGLTYKQILILHSDAVKASIEDYRMQAAMHGIKLKGEDSSTKLEKHEEPNPFMFRTKGDYEGMSLEERKETTRKMLSFYKEWAGERSSVGDLGAVSEVERNAD